MKLQYGNVAMERNQAHKKSAETQKLIDDVQRDLLNVTKQRDDVIAEKEKFEQELKTRSESVDLLKVRQYEPQQPRGGFEGQRSYHCLRNQH